MIISEVQLAKDVKTGVFKKYYVTLKGNADELMSEAQSNAFSEKFRKWQDGLDPISAMEILAVGRDSSVRSRKAYVMCTPEMAEIISRTMEKDLSVALLTGPEGETLFSPAAQFNRSRKAPPPLPKIPAPRKPPRPPRPRQDSTPS